MYDNALHDTWYPNEITKGCPKKNGDIWNYLLIEFEWWPGFKKDLIEVIGHQ